VAHVESRIPVYEKVAAENMLTGALGKLFALSESYPNLKANANFQQLQSDLSDIENKLAASRRFFNNAVQEYNTGIQVFPASLFAGYGIGTFLLALAGLAADGARGLTLLGRATRGSLFLSHWLLVVPAALLLIAVGPRTTAFAKTPRSGPGLDR